MRLLVRDNGHFGLPVVAIFETFKLSLGGRLSLTRSLNPRITILLSGGTNFGLVARLIYDRVACIAAAAIRSSTRRKKGEILQRLPLDSGISAGHEPPAE